MPGSVLPVLPVLPMPGSEQKAASFSGGKQCLGNSNHIEIVHGKFENVCVIFSNLEGERSCTDCISIKAGKVHPRQKF